MVPHVGSELLALLREHGVERIAEVHRAWLEGDGRLSVIKTRGEDAPSAPDASRAGRP